jgi:hypothetical protein
VFQGNKGGSNSQEELQIEVIFWINAKVLKQIFLLGDRNADFHFPTFSYQVIPPLNINLPTLSYFDSLDALNGYLLLSSNEKKDFSFDRRRSPGMGRVGDKEETICVSFSCIESCLE